MAHIARDPDRERGAASVEYVGVCLAVVVLIAAIVAAAQLSSVGQTLADKIGCSVRSLGTQAGDCGGSDAPTVYDGDGAAAPAGPSDGGGGSSTATDPTRYANASGEDDPVDQEKVDSALDHLRDALDGGFWGVKGGDLDDAKDAIDGLNGAEIDQLIASMSDDELEHWVDELDDGWFGGGWSREERRTLWEEFASKADKKTLDRLATFTDELQPGFEDVGGDGARDRPTSPRNTGEYGEVEHDLFVGSVSPSDVSQGQIGDCWYMASMMAVAQADPDVIRRAITQNANGSYTVTLYPDGERVDVTVTPDMVLMPDGTPAFASNDGRDEPYELWPMVLEKALAVQYGDYGDIEGGATHVGLTTLTGVPSESHDTTDLGVQGLADILDDGGAVGLSSLTKGDAKDSPYYQLDQGVDQLHPGHAYFIQSVDVAKGTVTVVNPWGIANNPPITMDYDDYVEAFRRVDTNEVS